MKPEDLMPSKIPMGSWICCSDQDVMDKIDQAYAHVEVEFPHAVTIKNNLFTNFDYLYYNLDTDQYLDAIEIEPIANIDFTVLDWYERVTSFFSFFNEDDIKIFYINGSTDHDNPYKADCYAGVVKTLTDHQRGVLIEYIDLIEKAENLATLEGEHSFAEYYTKFLTKLGYTVIAPEE